MYQTLLGFKVRLLPIIEIRQARILEKNFRTFSLTYVHLPGSAFQLAKFRTPLHLRDLRVTLSLL